MTTATVHPWAATQVPLFEGAVFLLDGEQRRVVAPDVTETDDGRRSCTWPGPTVRWSRCRCGTSSWDGACVRCPARL